MSSNNQGNNNNLSDDQQNFFNSFQMSNTMGQFNQNFNNFGQQGGFNSTSFADFTGLQNSTNFSSTMNDMSQQMPTMPGTMNRGFSGTDNTNMGNVTTQQNQNQMNNGTTQMNSTQLNSMNQWGTLSNNIAAPFNNNITNSTPMSPGYDSVTTPQVAQQGTNGQQQLNQNLNLNNQNLNQNNQNGQNQNGQTNNQNNQTNHGTNLINNLATGVANVSSPRDLNKNVDAFATPLAPSIGGMVNANNIPQLPNLNQSNSQASPSEKNYLTPEKNQNYDQTGRSVVTNLDQKQNDAKDRLSFINTPTGKNVFQDEELNLQGKENTYAGNMQAQFNADPLPVVDSNNIVKSQY